jgi:hypothetical protein
MALSSTISNQALLGVRFNALKHLIYDYLFQIINGYFERSQNFHQRLIV